MPDITAEQWIAEEELAQRLGVDREKMRAERTRLLAGEVCLEGKAVMWQRTAAARVASALGLPGSFLEKSAPEEAAAAVRQVEALTVASGPGPGGYHFANPHLIRARRASGELVVVRVVDSRKYVLRLQGRSEPMTLQARPSAAGNWWVLEGREPRWVGRW